MQLGREPDGLAAVLGIDIGSSYIKAHVLAVYTEDGKLKYRDDGCPYPDAKPRPSIVHGKPSSLQQWHNTRSGQIKNRLTYGRSTSRQYFQLVYPKRCFLVKDSEADAAKLAIDTGLPPEAAIADKEGWIAFEVSPGTIVNMNEVFGAMVHDILLDMHNDGLYDSILGVAVTLPHTISRAGRARAHAIIRQQLDIFEAATGSMLRNNSHPPYIGIIPEGVAVARELCDSNLSQPKEPIRVMTVDSGHSTLDVSQMTVEKVNSSLVISDVINTGNAFCGVKDVAHALMGKLPAAVLQQATQDTNNRSGNLYQVNAVLDYIDEMVVGGSQRNLATADRITSSSSQPQLLDQAPMTCGDVLEASKVLSEPGTKVVQRNLLLGKLCGHPSPSVVLMTGGGGMVPALKEAVRSAVEQGTKIVPSQGGNRQPVARGAALLLFDGLQRHHEQHLQQTGDYPKLLPDYWASPLGCSIGVWSSFSTVYVDGLTDKQQLENLKQRLTAAALLNDGGADAEQLAPQPDEAARKCHKAQMLAYIQHRITVLELQQQPARGRGRPRKGPKPPKVDADIPFYYSLLLPNSSVPCAPVKLPWKLYKPADGDTLRVQLVRIDPLGVEAETFAGDYLVPPPDANHCVQLAVEVDADGKIVCNAELKHMDDSDDVPGQPLQVETSHDRYAAQRRDRQQRVHQLPPLVQEFLRQLNGEEAAAVAQLSAQPAATPTAMQPTAAAPAGSSAAQEAAAEVGVPDGVGSPQQREVIAVDDDATLLAAAEHLMGISSELDLLRLLQKAPRGSTSPKQQPPDTSIDVQTSPADGTNPLDRLVELLSARNGVSKAAAPTAAVAVDSHKQADQNSAAHQQQVAAGEAGTAAASAAHGAGESYEKTSPESPPQDLAPPPAAGTAEPTATAAVGPAAQDSKPAAAAPATASVATDISSRLSSTKKRKSASAVVGEAMAAKLAHVSRSSEALAAQQARVTRSGRRRVVQH